jgi:hypothetical protein
MFLCDSILSVCAFVCVRMCVCVYAYAFECVQVVSGVMQCSAVQSKAAQLSAGMSCFLCVLCAVCCCVCCCVCVFLLVSSCCVLCVCSCVCDVHWHYRLQKARTRIVSYHIVSYILLYSVPIHSFSNPCPVLSSLLCSCTPFLP